MTNLLPDIQETLILMAFCKIENKVNGFERKDEKAFVRRK